MTKDVRSPSVIYHTVGELVSKKDYMALLAKAQKMAEALERVRKNGLGHSPLCKTKVDLRDCDGYCEEAIILDAALKEWSAE